MRKLLWIIPVFCLFTSFSPREITWVALGDSITYLNEHTNETGDRITKGYMTRVTEKLPRIHYVNQGHNGWTASRIAENIDKLGLTKADVYSVFLGTNDWWHWVQLGTFDDYKNNTGTQTVFGSYRIIINKLRSLNPKAKIILITPMQRSDFVYINDSKNNAWGSYKDKNGQSLAEFAAAIHTIARGQFDVVDLYNRSGITQGNLIKYKRLKDPKTGMYRNYPYPTFINVPFNPETDEYPYPVDAIDMTYDGLHPSDKGFEIIANMLVRVMKRY